MTLFRLSLSGAGHGKAALCKFTVKLLALRTAFGALSSRLSELGASSALKLRIYFRLGWDQVRSNECSFFNVERIFLSFSYFSSTTF